MMEKIFRKDISEKKEFDRIGYHYTQVLADNEKHVYLYKMSKPGNKHLQFELVKGKKYKNPDGNIIHTYPCDEDFGSFGWYICGRPEYVLSSIRKRWLDLTNYSPDFTL